MNKLTITHAKENTTPKIHPINLCWLDNPSVQKLLDAVSSIIANEYIQIAKQNPETFSNNGGQK